MDDQVVARDDGCVLIDDTAFCGGRWPADLIAEMEEAAATTDA